MCKCIRLGLDKQEETVLTMRILSLWEKNPSQPGSGSSAPCSNPETITKQPRF